LTGVTISTHRPSVRPVGADKVYKTKKEKRDEAIASVQARRQRGQIALERKFRLGSCPNDSHLAESGKTEISI
jgi:preprotein translocase subunit SecA